ncbi:MAG: BatA domain-containing protein [Planctomycetota bacterium]
MLSALHPWMLAGLAGAGLPILVHFLTRPRPRTIAYPTFHLLTEAGGGRQALHRLRTWLVLALRVLAAAALALAFARLYLRTPGADAEPGAPRRAVVVLDASLSMRAVRGGAPLFTLARAQAADVLRGLEPGSAAGVIFAGATPRSALPALSRNRAELHARLAGAAPTWERGDPNAALALANRLLEGNGTVYVFSDFQRTEWGAADFARYAGLHFYLRPVTEAPVANVAVVAVAVEPAEPIAGEAVEVIATILNATAQARRETVRLELEGVSRTAEAELAPYASGTVRFSFTAPRQGVLPGRVLVGGDALPEDGVRYFRLPVCGELRVLVLSDADPGDAAHGALYVRTALKPSDFVAPGVTVLRRRTQGVDQGALEGADVFVLVAPAVPDGPVSEAIARRLRDGASLLCLMDHPDAPGLLGALAGVSEGRLAPPFRLLRPVEGRADGLRLTPAGAAVLDTFSAAGEGDLATLTTRRHYLTEPLPGREAEILAAYPDGSAGIALSPVGHGRAIFANLPAAPDAGAMAGSPLFPSLLHELLRLLRAGGEGDEAAPGHAWRLTVPSGGAAAPRVAGPDGEGVDATVLSRGRTLRLALPPAQRPGIYTVRAGEETLAIGVVNVDARESDTRPIRLDAILDRTASGDGGGVTVLDAEGQLARAGAPTRLWPWLLGAAAACLALEMLVLAVWRSTARRRTAGGAA